MESTPKSSYALALLTLMEEGTNDDNQPLGTALHLREAPLPDFTSTTKLAPHRLLRALIEHSPSPEVVAQQFMTVLAQCENLAVVALGDALFCFILYLC